MWKTMKVFGMAVLCAILLVGCGTSTSSNEESPSSSAIVQGVASLDSSEGSNESLEEFESLKDEAEKLLEEGKYKEAVVAATKAYQLVEDKDGEEEIPLRVAEKLAEECGLKNPKAEIDTTAKSSIVNFVQISCDNLEKESEDEIIRIYNELSDRSNDVLQAGGIEGKEGKTEGIYTIWMLISEGKRYFVFNLHGKDELVIMDDEDAQKRATEKKFSTGGTSSSKESSMSNNQAVSQEYKNALSKGLQYANQLHMSKQAVYDQLTSSYGEGFPADAARYAVDNMTSVDWNANALAKARQYYYNMSMSKSAVYDQLTSSYGERFTASQAQYAIDHLD